MQNGKHVLCEKPLASNSKEVLDMIATSKKYGVTLMEAMKSTLAPSFKVLQSYVPKLGTIRRYFSSYCQYSSRYDKFKEGIVLNAFNPEYSNGAIMDIGVYTIYPMVVLFGRPKKIIANGIVLSSGADGQGTVVCEYDGFDATVIHSKIADSSLPSEIQGENGSLIMNRINKIEEVTWNPRKSSPEKLAEGMEKNEYYYEIEEFINLIENGKIQSEINTHQNSLMTIEIIDEVRRQLGVKYPADNFLE
ncbi:Gfo/Idh/MocA family oxidoreductase [Histomonas meleagridis]|uniref:Gfo/Idh/MocA family oxidoreductase n=1 Tax=Histomonas meleagridis TaxID=135588 RepID=UPI003559D055|nr:Gfo/Idh/MocA family oxidoreductase [Histomonas meleagridis]KAH0806615.1 Gfo/Idh/MocA family oxidoreductase [Histomonas meleagridis]